MSISHHFRIQQFYKQPNEFQSSTPWPMELPWYFQYRDTFLCICKLKKLSVGDLTWEGAGDQPKKAATLT